MHRPPSPLLILKQNPLTLSQNSALENTGLVNAVLEGLLLLAILFVAVCVESFVKGGM